jgi:hypothetical protein
MDRVPPGQYSIRLLPSSRTLITLEVKDRDVENVEVPVGGYVFGRVNVEGGGVLPTLRASLPAGGSAGMSLVRVGTQAANVRSNAPVRTDGWFAMALHPGEYDLGFLAVPFGYTLSKNAQTTQRIKVETTPLLVQLALSKTTSDGDERGVRVVGRVTGLASGTTTETHWLSLTSAPVRTVGGDPEWVTEIPLRADGSFEILDAPRGTFAVRLVSPSTSVQLQPPALIVAGENIDALEFTVPQVPAAPYIVPANALTTILAVIYVVDEKGTRLRMSPVSFGVRLATSSTEFTQRRSSPSGIPAFPFTVQQTGLYSIEVTDLPEGFSVRSIARGGEEIGQSGLAVDGRFPSMEIQVTLEYRPVNSGPNPR